MAEAQEPPEQVLLPLKVTHLVELSHLPAQPQRLVLELLPVLELPLK